MYLAFATSAFQSQFVYRGQVWAGLFGDAVQVFARIAIWTAVYQGATNVGGITLPDMITYTVLSVSILAAWDYSSFITTIGNQIKTGDVAVYLLKPLSYPSYLLATEAGNLAYSTLTGVLPVTLLIVLTYGVQPPASLFHAAMFVPFWLLAFLILFLIATLLGLLAFWMMTAFSLAWFLQAVMALLSGTFIPLWFFPAPLGAVIGWLPFAFIGYYPTAVYLGKLDVASTFGAFALGVGWAVTLTLCVAWLWGRAARRITVQGG